MTPDANDRHAAIDAADRLQGSVIDLKDEIGSLRDYGQRSRRIIWGLAVSLALDVALSIVVIFVAIQAQDANTLAQANRQTQIATCESGNQSRQVALNLWTYVLDAAAVAPENQTPERKKQLVDFRTYMESAYTPRDCTKTGR